MPGGPPSDCAHLHHAAFCRRLGARFVDACCTAHVHRYDPMAIKAGQAGYGSGSGAPNVMLAFLKHTWITGERKEAYYRCVHAYRPSGAGPPPHARRQPFVAQGWVLCGAYLAVRTCLGSFETWPMLPCCQPLTHLPHPAPGITSPCTLLCTQAQGRASRGVYVPPMSPWPPHQLFSS